ncbi:hypothetical protein [[Phormidium] sp. ETS-05]|uniref:hypothetical protein n=1 Tax=[Phormidium] sp. ETS-05 TaxID=222819 RepID=UPI0018EED9B5|nr:hypothetical protein [[Phormidium] sp. ETS-05]
MVAPIAFLWQRGDRVGSRGFLTKSRFGGQNCRSGSRFLFFGKGAIGLSGQLQEQVL